MALLSRIERREMELLGWGVIDGSFSWDEVHEMTVSFLEELGLESDAYPEEFINDLLARRLLLPDGILPDHYRSRMAETVRLARQLRQIFPGDDSAWETAPSLVSDYRLGIAERRYPKRDLSPREFVEAFHEASHLADIELSAIRALLDRGSDFYLADFQLRATIEVYRGAHSGRDHGTVVAAGTGSGKTLAFYLPALTWIAGVLEGESWTKAVAIYPRIELIKDQVQTAYIEARRLDQLLRKNGKRKVRIGVFFGDTPNTSKTVDRKSTWPRGVMGFSCPLFSCPHCRDGLLIWRHEDVAKGIEKLVCEKCAGIISSDEISLTRHSMAKNPPDILFTSTEMLNRELLNNWNRHIFGVGIADETRRPRFLLMDEIHVNQGTSGAQVALLMRRWRNAVRSPLSLVGLSATLEDAPHFFAQLLGLNESQVREVSPYEREMVREGMEYNLILKGDPTSGTSLLSTTIQTAMLMRRMLDTNDDVSNGAIGQRLYAFTDQLDVVNRLYWNLMSAEGWRTPRDSLSRRPRSLAGLRSPSRQNRNWRWPRGQSWDSAVSIGHSLDDRASLTIGRTSSQDAGVAMHADVIVATASVEVGFDDSRAGAVLQHKAPKQASSFVQRKGRAGRARGMRPWTVVVLSDYGRDQASFLQFESLFAPALERQVLPVSNRYVLRMQGALVLLEWLSNRLGKRPRGNIWNDAARPAQSVKTGDKERQDALAGLTYDLLTTKSLQVDLQFQLSRSLGISQEEAQAVLWEGPRSLLMEVLPTLHRRLASHWRSMNPSQPEPVTRNPLPEFIPANLFSDLLVPEVQFSIPIDRRGANRQDSMGILQALSEFSPGRVSKRFGIEYQRLSHWVPTPLTASGSHLTPLDLSNYVTDFEVLGDFSVHVDGGAVETVRCLRPLSYELDLVPPDVRDTSSSTPLWCSQFVRETSPNDAYIPAPSLWADLIASLTFHLHVTGDQITVRRFYRDVEVDIRTASGQGDRYLGRLVHNESQSSSVQPNHVALGYESQVDAVCIRLDERVTERILREGNSQDALFASRRAFFEDGVLNSERLTSELNVFQREWLAFLCEATIVEMTRERDEECSELIPTLDIQEFTTRLRRTLDATVGRPAEEPGQVEEGDTGIDEDEQSRLYRGLLEAIQNSQTTGELIHLLGRLHGGEWGDPDFQIWQRNRFKAVFAGAFLHSMARINSQVDVDSLVVDLDGGPTQSGARENAPTEVWISESVPGGVGVLEQVQQSYDTDPRRFWDIVEGILDQTSEEDVDISLSFLTEQASKEDIAEAMGLFRGAYSQGHTALYAAFERLLAVLDHAGFIVNRATVAALMARVLRAGTTPATDSELRRLLLEWDALQSRAGFDVGIRVAAYVLSADPLEAFSLHTSSSRGSKFQLLQSLLWERGLDSRKSKISYFNRFRKTPQIDRLLLADAIASFGEPISVGSRDWRDLARDQLAAVASVTLECEIGLERTLKSAVSELVSTPVDVGYLLVFPRVVGINRRGTRIMAYLNLRESTQ